MDDVFTPLPDQTQSGFHGGLAMIYRLNDIHKQIHHCRVLKDYEGWYDWLTCLYTELSPLMSRKINKDPKKSDYFDSNDEPISQYKYFVEFWQDATTALNNIKQKRKIAKSLRCLMQWEDELGLFEQKIGAKMPKKADGRLALG